MNLKVRTLLVGILLCCIIIPSCGGTSNNDSNNNSNNSSIETQANTNSNSKVAEQTNNKQIIDLVKSFNEAGLKADTVETMFYQIIGACSGYSVNVNGEIIEIYKFDLSDKGQKSIAEEIDKSGILTVGSMKNPALYSNGFVIIGYQGHPAADKIKEVLSKF